MKKKTKHMKKWQRLVLALGTTDNSVVNGHIHANITRDYPNMDQIGRDIRAYIETNQVEKRRKILRAVNEVFNRDYKDNGLTTPWIDADQELIEKCEEFVDHLFEVIANEVNRAIREHE